MNVKTHLYLKKKAKHYFFEQTNKFNAFCPKINLNASGKQSILKFLTNIFFTRFNASGKQSFLQFQTNDQL